jgi:hypothetical protein
VLWDRDRSKLVWQAAERKAMTEELEQVLEAYGADYKPSQPQNALVPLPQRDRPDVVPALDTSGFPGMNAETAGDLASFTDDLIVRVLQYAGAVNRYGAFTGTEGTAIARDPLSLARFARVSKAIYRFVRLYRVQLGFFGDEAQELERIAWDTSALKNPHQLTELTPSMLRGIKQAADIVLKSVPRRSVLVGMGNSPAPIMGYLELHHPGELALVHMPMGNVHSNPTEESREADRSLEMYFKYFDLFPGLSAATVNDRTVVLLDYSVEGRALRLANHLLVRYYESRLHLSVQEAREKVRLIAILSPQSLGTYLQSDQASETFDPHQLRRIEAKRLGADLTAFAEAMDHKWVKDHFGLMLFKSLDRQKIAKGETPQLLPAHYQRLLVQLRRPLNDPELDPSDKDPL